MLLNFFKLLYNCSLFISFFKFKFKSFSTNLLFKLLLITLINGSLIFLVVIGSIFLSKTDNPLSTLFKLILYLSDSIISIDVGLNNSFCAFN